mmetsp:Transcript_1731/g.3885  ORF Transcript_1731/g.3885 Transcript_1731/m.3885 type:complete len:215 (-) Transcript_1731:519-1163(-)
MAIGPFRTIHIPMVLESLECGLETLQTECVHGDLRYGRFHLIRVHRHSRACRPGDGRLGHVQSALAPPSPLQGSRTQQLNRENQSQNQAVDGPRSRPQHSPEIHDVIVDVELGLSRGLHSHSQVFEGRRARLHLDALNAGRVKDAVKGLRGVLHPRILHREKSTCPIRRRLGRTLLVLRGLEDAMLGQGDARKGLDMGELQDPGALQAVAKQHL